jgi:hypothetical protein
MIQWIFGRMAVVQYSTIKRDLTSIHKWGIEAKAAGLVPSTWVCPSTCAEVAFAKKCAKKWAVTSSLRKWEITPATLQRFFEATAHQSSWLVHMYRLTAASAYGSLVRRQALASMRWKSMPGSNGLLPSPNSDVKFDKHGLTESMQLHANFEKNQVRTITTTRHFDDANCAGIPLASICRESLQMLQLPDGPLLREAPESTQPAGKLFWHKFLSFFCEVTHLPRENYGMQSFRRGYAVALREIGRLTVAELQTVGYWWAGGSVDIYAGSARQMRLNLQRRPENRVGYADAVGDHPGTN